MDSPRDRGWSARTIAQVAQTLAIIGIGMAFVLAQQKNLLPSNVSALAFPNAGLAHLAMGQA
jgi:hypothetical protein